MCVDKPPPGSPPRPPLPTYVTAVPTLMIQGEAGPRTDGAVMNWLSERKMFASGSTGGSAGSSAGSAGNRSIPASSILSDGPAAFIGGDAFDDGLALIGEDTGNTNRLTGSMASLNDLSSLAAPDSRTIPGNSMASGSASAFSSASGSGAGGAPQSAKAKAMEVALENYLASRDRDVKGVITRR